MATLTWTKHVITCDSCHRKFRVSQESLDEAMKEFVLDADALASISMCIGCVMGHSPDGEYDIPTTHEYDGHFQLTGLTARDLFAIHAALEVACDDEEEPYPGLNDALTKVEKVVKDLRAAGIEDPTPETSAQSQAFIDGASPFFNRDEPTDENDEDDDQCSVCGEEFKDYGPGQRSAGDPSMCEYCFTHEGED